MKKSVRFHGENFREISLTKTGDVMMFRWISMMIFVHMYPYGSSMIQPYLIRKYDWGMMTRELSTFSDSVWIHRVCTYIVIV